MLATYYLPTDEAANPVSMVVVQTQDGDSPNDDSYRTAWTFIDGLGRSVLSVTQADPDKGDLGAFLSGGAVSYNRKGQVVAASLVQPRPDGDTIVAPPTIKPVDDPPTEPPTNLNAAG